MEINNIAKNTPTVVEWLGDDRGDNLAIKSGLRIFTVDKYGTLTSQRYKRAQARPVTAMTTNTVIEGLSDLKIGYTYTISQSDVVIGKLLESNLFGYRFLSVNPQGHVTFIDIDYVDATKHLQAGNIKQVIENVCED